MSPVALRWVLRNIPPVPQSECLWQPFFLPQLFSCNVEASGRERSSCFRVCARLTLCVFLMSWTLVTVCLFSCVSISIHHHCDVWWRSPPSDVIWHHGPVYHLLYIKKLKPFFKEMTQKWKFSHLLSHFKLVWFSSAKDILGAKKRGSHLLLYSHNYVVYG